MFGAGSGDTTRRNLAAVSHEPAQTALVLVVEERHAVETELALLLAQRALLALLPLIAFLPFRVFRTFRTSRHGAPPPHASRAPAGGARFQCLQDPAWPRRQPPARRPRSCDGAPAHRCADAVRAHRRSCSGRGTW